MLSTLCARPWGWRTPGPDFPRARNRIDDPEQACHAQCHGPAARSVRSRRRRARCGAAVGCSGHGDALLRPPVHFCRRRGPGAERRGAATTDLPALIFRGMGSARASSPLRYLAASMVADHRRRVFAAARAVHGIFSGWSWDSLPRGAANRRPGERCGLALGRGFLAVWLSLWAAGELVLVYLSADLRAHLGVPASVRNAQRYGVGHFFLTGRCARLYQLRRLGTACFAGRG